MPAEKRHTFIRQPVLVEPIARRVVTLTVVRQMAHEKVDLVEPNPLVGEDRAKGRHRLELLIPCLPMHRMLGVVIPWNQDLPAGNPAERSPCLEVFRD